MPSNPTSSVKDAVELLLSLTPTKEISRDSRSMHLGIVKSASELPWRLCKFSITLGIFWDYHAFVVLTLTSNLLQSSSIRIED